MDQILRAGARCAVIGHGSWATALVKILLENEPRVGWYVRNPRVLTHLREKGTNPKYLAGVHFDTSKLDLSEDINHVVSQYDIIVLAVPSAFLTTFLAPLTVPLEGKFVISAIKGIIPGDHLTVAEYINMRYGVPFDRLGVVTGPCHSEEVALERLSYLTMVCKSPADATVLCGKFSTDFIRTNPSTDIYGAEYAAVLKNIYAVCAGIAVGLGYGDNFLSVLVANGAMEMERFLHDSYPSDRDICASAYLGDLLVTCYSQFSRNRTFGAMIGKGYSIGAAQAEMNMVAEGYYASGCIRQVSQKHGIDMPIADCVYRILYEKCSPAAQMEQMTHKLI